MLAKGLESDAVLRILADDLRRIGFMVESSKTQAGRLSRPVFFGENGEATLRYAIDGYCQDVSCGLEVEAGRAVLGNAIFRDLFQAMVMVDIKHLCLAVPHIYKHNNAGRSVGVPYYQRTAAVADALYGHSRVVMPYGLTVIGY